MVTARFKIYDPVEGNRTIVNDLQARMSIIYCQDPETGLCPDSYGYTWEKRISDTHSQIWIRTSEEVMMQIKETFADVKYQALGFEHIEDIEEPQAVESESEPEPPMFND